MPNLRKIASDVLPKKYKDKLRHAVHPARRAALARRLGRHEPDLGMLTVVIPVFNVAEYVADCLSSVVGQSYSNLEIIVVDDGSTDDSMRIVAEFAKRDNRISMIRLENGGNGRARNVGISAARGTYLTFADSDDIVEPGAYALMMATITTSGSDFVVGSSVRLIGKKRQETKLSRRMHAEKRLGISIDGFPDILDDVFLWNKVFRKNFWDDQVAPIPERILYEDQETTARAYIRAKSFDVIQEEVYSWRQRLDGSSITQGKRSERDLEDRLAVAHQVTALLAAEGSQAILEKWFVRLFDSDLMPYYGLVPHTPDRYWTTLRQGIISLDRLLSDSLSSSDTISVRINPHARVFLALVKAGLKHDLGQVVVDRMEIGTGFKVSVLDRKFYAAPNYASALPEFMDGQMLECRPELMQPETQITMQGWSDAGDLLLVGYGLLRGLDDECVDHRVSVQCADAALGWRELDTKVLIDRNLDSRVNDPFASHANAAFSLVVPKALLPAALTEQLIVRISIVAAGHTFSQNHFVSLPRRANTDDEINSSRQVVGFSVNPEAEEFTIDVDWGNAPRPGDLYLATRQHRIDAEENRILGANISRYTFRLANVAWAQSVEAPRSGAYTVRYLSQGSDSTTAVGKTLRVADRLNWDLPMTALVNHASIQAWTTDEGNLAVTLGPPLDCRERGSFWQRELQSLFQSMEDIEISQHTLFESFGGKQCTDSPRALSDAMYRKDPSSVIYWSIIDYSVKYPQYAIPVIRGSRRWYDVVATAKLIVNNQNFPHYFRKNPRQRYLQTWHGTPLKKIGFDVPTHTISPLYRQALHREAETWDALVVQNDFSATVLPRALGHSGQIINVGYPRNDSLRSGESYPNRTPTRKIFGASDSDFVVLYAPTWRETRKDSGNNLLPFSSLDVDLLLSHMPPGTILLMRSHHNIQIRTETIDHDSVLDVSGYPEINDLIVASDVLITDYSSIIFDYAVTEKPIIYYAPDLSEYRDITRGFYLDYEDIAGSALCSTTSEVIMQLSDIVTSNARSQTPAELNADSLRKRQEYAPHDDGGASNRVLSCFETSDQV